MENSMGKRKMSRVDFKVDAVISTSKIKKRCTVRDLSLAGIYITTDLDLEIGEKADIKLEISSNRTSGKIELAGEVVRKDTFGVAFEFSELPLDTYVFLRNIIVYNYGDAKEVDKEYRRHLAERKMRKT
jgi:hypothetical protein